MKKILFILCIGFLSVLLNCTQSHAASYETKVVFVSSRDKSAIESAVESSLSFKYHLYGKRKDKAGYDRALDRAKNKIESFVFDINELTNKGWEIKTSRRAWTDLNGDGEPDSYEWGTEYTLQRKKGWW